MKSKILIALLQKEDPTGELEVCIGNVDIYFVNRLPPYYDGALQVIQRNEYGRAVSAEYRRHGPDKLSLVGYSVEDAIWDNQDFPVTIDDKKCGYLHDLVQKYRDEAKQCEDEIKKEQDGRKAL